MFRKIITIALFFGAIGVLFSLSWWQVKRLSWKENVITRLEVQYQKDPAQNQFNFHHLKNLEHQDLPLLYGQVTGKFIHDKEILWGPKPLNGEIGYNIITPLKLNSGEYILVHRGWIAQSKRNNMHHTSRPPVPITVTGLFRKPEWNIFTPNNSPANNIWTKPDINEIARVQNIAPIAPVMLYAHHMSKEFEDGILKDEKWFPRNKHKQYALFWFIMGLAFIGVFGLFWNKTFKK